MFVMQNVPVAEEMIAIKLVTFTKGKQKDSRSDHLIIFLFMVALNFLDK